MAEIVAATPRRQTVAGDLKLVGLVNAAHLTSHFYQLVLPPIFPLLTGVFGVEYAEPTAASRAPSSPLPRQPCSSLARR